MRDRMRRKDPQQPGWWRNKRWQRGVTLIELMIVVVLIGALAALATPSVMRTLDRLDGRSAARDIANTFRMARDHAMSRKVIMMVVFRSVTGGHNIEVYRSNLNHCAAIFADGDGDGDGDAMDDFQLVHTLDFPARFPNMTIFSWDDSAHGVATSPICISPSGKFLTIAGQPISNTSTNCGRYNQLIWIGRSDWDGSGALNECLEDGVATDADRQALRDQRDIHNFYMIHLGYNGSIEVVQ